MLAMAMAGFLSLSSGACIEGTMVSCSIPNCAQAYKVCEYPGMGPCECYAWATTTETVKLPGKYAILGIWYAAPGPGSNTNYSTNTQIGTSVSTTTGSGGEIAVGTAAGYDFTPLASANATLTYDQQWSSSSTTQMDSKLTQTSAHIIPGSGTDLVDHGEDQIVLLLKPEVTFTGTFVAGQLSSVK